MSPQRIAVLGATGSIGGSALDVIARHPDRFRASVLAANTRVDELLDLCRRFHPEIAVIADPAGFHRLREGLRAAGLKTEPLAGPEALAEAAASDRCETVVAAIVGAAGMASTLAAARAGKRLLLANKESVVLAGALLVREAEAHGARIIPIDSEHNAIFQCLPADRALHGGVHRLLLTASGGPFRGWTRERLAGVTPEQACAHPNWTMGRKISVDSATLMNKGLEVIEAHWLFGLPPERIEVVVHPQSVVHSLVDYVDGSVLAQLGNPDMRTALACGLAWPERVSSGVAPLDLAAIARLDFEPPDRATFPCLDLAYAALRAGGTAPAILNAANEVAVSAFLQRRLGFLGIPALIAATLDAVPDSLADSLDVLQAADAEARRQASALITRFAN
ncbi:1-deoxy-D-xylulose-5-phosphate reductoisomerase [Rehaibacterium terrae]|jgi:1-deoxy-D-xylulose-5-phosphate reductoisomerase|uniref:1-deoxy-D-xylulose 5-phosphate reductoisomerase n=1 Tax=Rehaibacterium terrae TaxID=1341696 RepID=A0A7W7XYN1_9GAMM|nr:1-deoxy-D-xylulose-5-phosphate reductoisomerase [Rehaibacterium terrae]MBB5014843.1 1-deoxy-D-xylulose-5-phosphate reductoisomerase [Rehaibacterium terrae]